VTSLQALSVAGFEVKIRQPVSSDTVHDNPLLNRLYLSRGICRTEELETDIAQLLDWRSMAGITQAVDLLLQARGSGQKVIIVGDYDADGATSTALAILGLCAMGLNVQYVLPNRFDYGYGLSSAIVELVLQQNPDVILTVDNGISSFDGVALAKQHGVKVLITDHHLASDRLPNADAIVNPNQSACEFESKAACGCAVLFYLLIALRAKLRELGESGLPNLAQWLDLVALATVADVVPLDRNNRLIVQNGLQRVRQGRMRPGIKALFEVSGRDWQNASASDFGFCIGPRLNAAGRLGDMSLGVRLLLTDDPGEARAIASELHELNSERRQIEASMLKEIEPVVSAVDTNKASESHKVISQVVYGDHWHEGVIGIVASRIKEKLHCPVVAFAKSDSGELKGSARSIQGVHLRDCLDWISKQQEGLILKFGGHAMAAGLSIKEQDLDSFKIWLDKSVRLFAEPEALTPQLWVDGVLNSHELTLENALQLEQAGPWGQAFPSPAFYGDWPVLERRVLGGKHLKLTLQVDGQPVSAIAFNVPELCVTESVDRVKGIYELSCNRFRGELSLQLVFSKIEVC
jgi:single-stranded-DNA-specific exonuclease